MGRKRDLRNNFIDLHKVDEDLYLSASLVPTLGIETNPLLKVNRSLHSELCVISVSNICIYMIPVLLLLYQQQQSQQ